MRCLYILYICKATACSAEDAVFGAFSVLYHFIHLRDTKLLLRFAYVYLTDTIDALVNTASTEQRGPGYRSESPYIAVYLAAKGKPPNDRKSRNQLS